MRGILGGDKIRSFIVKVYKRGRDATIEIYYSKESNKWYQHVIDDEGYIAPHRDKEYMGHMSLGDILTSLEGEFEEVELIKVNEW